jgi:type II secretory ATPase GspE/PulE/Tfp pilus assembly ATPase PilB-like protein
MTSATQQYVDSASNYAQLEIGTLVNHIIEDAVRANASDVHIEPWEKRIVVRFRLIGVLNEIANLPKEVMDRVSARLKVMASLVTYMTDLPQEGHVPADPALGGVELRLSFFPTVRGEKIVVRIFNPTRRTFDLGSLGFEPHSLESFIKLLARPTGLILMTGPTGSGKTTAIYSAIQHLVDKHGSTISISTIEDPVESHLPTISQAQVNRAKEFTYPIGLRSLMRQDPQVIAIGEIRDAETAAIAVQAGLTGHLVISTIHSSSTAGVFARLINMEIEPFLLSSSIIGVMGLRLIRQNCPMCSVPYEPEPSSLKLIPPDLLDQATFRKGEGCATCMQNGFSGRSALTEMLVVNEVLRDAILQKHPTRTLQEIAAGQGMETLWDAGLRRVCAGFTTMEELLRVVAVDQF